MEYAKERMMIETGLRGFAKCRQAWRGLTLLAVALASLAVLSQAATPNADAVGGISASFDGSGVATGTWNNDQGGPCSNNSGVRWSIGINWDIGNDTGAAYLPANQDYIFNVDCASYPNWGPVDPAAHGDPDLLGSCATLYHAPNNNIQGNDIAATTCTGEPPPTDVCPNIDGVQETLPDGFFIDSEGNCVEDACPNIDGDQASVPDGFFVDEEGNCIVDGPAIDLNKTAVDTTVNAGVNVIYTIVVTNIGNVTLDNVEVDDNVAGLLSESDILSISVTPGNPACEASDTFPCDLGSMDPGDVVTISVTLDTDPGSCGTVTNSATATGVFEAEEISDTDSGNAVVVGGCDSEVAPTSTPVNQVQQAQATPTATTSPPPSPSATPLLQEVLSTSLPSAGTGGPQGGGGIATVIGATLLLVVAGATLTWSYRRRRTYEGGGS